MHELSSAQAAYVSQQPDGDGVSMHGTHVTFDVTATESVPADRQLPAAESPRRPVSIPPPSPGPPGLPPLELGGVHAASPTGVHPPSSAGFALLDEHA